MSRHTLNSGERVCIIGAGASGLTIARALQDRGIPYDHFEMGEGLGGVWRYGSATGRSPAYRNLHLITSKQHTAFDEYPMGDEIPTYPSHDQVLRYLEEYAEAFDLHERIQFNQRVTAVRADGNGRWIVERADGSTGAYGAVMVCSGHLWNRRWPEKRGTFSGRTLHAREYRRPEEFAGERVLVVGIGNSGCDIAVDLAHTAEDVHLSTRSSAWVLPKYILGIPTDQWTGYYMEYLPLQVRRWLLRLLRWMTVGSQESYGVPLPEHKLFQEHPTLNQYLLSYAGHGRIHIRPDIQQLEGSAVAFSDGTVDDFDTIIYATGYDLSFPFLETDEVAPRNNWVPLYRDVVPPELPGLYFIGLIQPLGALFPLAERQARWIGDLLTGTLALPDAQTMWNAIEAEQQYRKGRYHESPRHTLEVDFWDYVHTLERERQEGRKRASGSER